MPTRAWRRARATAALSNHTPATHVHPCASQACSPYLQPAALGLPACHPSASQVGLPTLTLTLTLTRWVYRILDCDTSGVKSAMCQKLVEIESGDEQKQTLLIGATPCETGGKSQRGPSG